MDRLDHHLAISNWGSIILIAATLWFTDNFSFQRADTLQLGPMYVGFLFFLNVIQYIKRPKCCPLLYFFIPSHIEKFKKTIELICHAWAISLFVRQFVQCPQAALRYILQLRFSNALSVLFNIEHNRGVLWTSYDFICRGWHLINIWTMLF